MSANAFKVPIGQLGQRLIADAGARAQAVRKGLHEGSIRGASYLARKTVRRYMGQMANSWQPMVTRDGARILNAAPHAGIIEAGARPHAVSTEGQAALLDWVLTEIAPQAHGPASALNRGAVRNLKRVLRGEKLGKRVNAYAALGALIEAKRIVFLICQKIKHHGVKGDFIAKKALPQLGAFARSEIGRVMEQAAAAAAIGRALGAIGGSGYGGGA